jgi:hypothetical protein
MDTWEFTSTPLPALHNRREDREERHLYDQDRCDTKEDHWFADADFSDLPWGLTEYSHPIHAIITTTGTSFYTLQIKQQRGPLLPKKLHVTTGIPCLGNDVAEEVRGKRGFILRSNISEFIRPF